MPIFGLVLVRQIKWKVAQWAELIWWQNYLAKRSKQRYLSWKRTYWKNFLEQTGVDKQLVPGVRILEVGCGPAGIFSILTGMEMIAVDPLINLYHERIAHFNLQDYPHVRFFNIPLENFSTNKTFDFIFCINVINHVKDMEAAVQQMTKFTSPHGKLILSVEVHRYRFLKRIFQIFPLDILHPHQHDLAR